MEMNLSNASSDANRTKKTNHICRYFVASGDCFYGDDCQFQHCRPQRPVSASSIMQNSSNAQGLGNPTDSNASPLPAESKLQSYLHKEGNNSMFTADTLNASMSAINLDAGSKGRRAAGSNHLQPPSNTHLTINQTSSNHLSSPNSVAGVRNINSTYFASEDLKTDILRRQAASFEQANPELFPDLPGQVENYQDLHPLESHMDLGKTSTTFNTPTSVYRATSIKNGNLYCLRRIHNYAQTPQNAKSLINTIEAWKKFQHPNLVQLHHVFTSKAFGDNSLIFVFEYFPNSETLMNHHFLNQNSLSGSSSFVNGYSTSSRPYSQQQSKRKLLPEPLIWNYIIQLSSALRTIHSNALAYRAFDPTKIILCAGQNNQSSRLRLSSCGVFDLLTLEAISQATNANALVVHFQQEDLVAFGKVCLALACNSLSATQRENWQGSVEFVARHYSADLKTLILYLLQRTNTSSPNRSINDIMPMIGARFYVQMENLYHREDMLIGELEKELDNGRLVRILVKLGSINERPEFRMDPNWAETGDRYLLKLFRDYLFHQMNEDGTRPWLDLAHVVNTLNKLDVGSPEKICLMSRDEQNILIVSFAELKRCFVASFSELCQ